MLIRGDVITKIQNNAIYNISLGMTRSLILLQTHDDVIKWKQFFALLALCVGNSPVTGEFPAQRPLTPSFDVFFDLICDWINGWEN